MHLDVLRIGTRKVCKLCQRMIDLDAKVCQFVMIIETHPLTSTVAYTIDPGVTRFIL